MTFLTLDVIISVPTVCQTDDPKHQEAGGLSFDPKGWIAYLCGYCGD